MRCKACNNPLDCWDTTLCLTCLQEAYKYAGIPLVQKEFLDIFDEEIKNDDSI
jgi:hypothetical protein